MSGVERLTLADASSAVPTLAAYGVAAAHEVYGKAGLLDPHIRPIQEGVRLAGPAVTVLCPAGDNLMIHMAVERCRPGDVLVVATMPPGDASGVIGELLATALRAHGVVAAIIDAGVRDIAELRVMAFPVWSRWITAQGTTKRGAGAVDRPVVCGGQEVKPGDIIVADDDGVACIAAASAIDVARGVVERVAHESSMRARLAAGELSADILGLRDAAAGIRTESGKQ
ncbi:MAG: 4-carboxy-4-hydroxy-2-oxoadipate aldolase/oxaloacetate decarboxylase [Candidatus Dormibacteria bacterium]